MPYINLIANCCTEAKFEIDAGYERSTISKSAHGKSKNKAKERERKIAYQRVSGVGLLSVGLLDLTAHHHFLTVFVLVHFLLLLLHHHLLVI